MNKAKKVMLTVGLSMMAGAMIGMLYAPDKGWETRRRIRKLKQKFSCCGDDDDEDYDRETLEELSDALKEQLNKVNERLEKRGG